MIYITTSWDDGHALDIRLAKLLDHYGMKGTFYIAKEYRTIGALLTSEEIKKISERHEIGAHTLTHPDLTALAEVQVREEIARSKQWLESVIGATVRMFCYPSGRYDEQVLDIVKEAGFAGARTVKWPSIYFPVKLYEMTTTLPVYPLPFRRIAGGRYWWRKLLQPVFERYQYFRALGVPLWRMYSWGSAARAAFDCAYQNGDIFHLWGHSWEIENYDLWDELNVFFAYIASKSDVCFVTNGELIDIAQQHVIMLGDGLYGGWATSPSGLNEQSIAYSFGVGEDASWDVAMIQKFGMRIYAFDPSQKSIAWVKTQGPKTNFIFHPYGLSNHDGVDEFYPPPNPKNVSYSTVRKVGAPHSLPVKRLATIMKGLGHNHIDILKMDIEGSEYKALDDLLASGVHVSQLLVEFHDRFTGKRKTKKSVEKLLAAGYKILYISRGNNEYSFIKS